MISKSWSRCAPSGRKHLWKTLSGSVLVQSSLGSWGSCLLSSSMWLHNQKCSSRPRGQYGAEQLHRLLALELIAEPIQPLSSPNLPSGSFPQTPAPSWSSGFSSLYIPDPPCIAISHRNSPGGLIGLKTNEWKKKKRSLHKCRKEILQSQSFQPQPAPSDTRAASLRMCSSQSLGSYDPLPFLRVVVNTRISRFSFVFFPLVSHS